MSNPTSKSAVDFYRTAGISKKADVKKLQDGNVSGIEACLFVNVGVEDPDHMVDLKSKGVTGSWINACWEAGIEKEFQILALGALVLTDTSNGNHRALGLLRGPVQKLRKARNLNLAIDVARCGLAAGKSPAGTLSILARSTKLQQETQAYSSEELQIAVTLTEDEAAWANGDLEKLKGLNVKLFRENLAIARNTLSDGA